MKNNNYVILIVEDDRKLSDVLQDYFDEEGFIVLSAQDGQEAVEVFFENNNIIDIILLDGMLPRLDGYEVLSRIREDSTVPVIMLTAREAEEEQLEGLRKGADIYMTKPFLMSVVLEHAKALLKRTGKKNQHPLVKGGIELHPDGRKVFVKNEELALTAKEYELLFYLMCNERIVLSREKILDTVWGYNYYGDMRVVDTFIKQLRKKLGPFGKYIKAVYSVGYRFEVSENE